MNWRITYRLVCSGDTYHGATPHECIAESQVADSKFEAVALAKIDGWRFTQKHSYCPNHPLSRRNRWKRKEAEKVEIIREENYPSLPPLRQRVRKQLLS